MPELNLIRANQIGSAAARTTTMKFVCRVAEFARAAIYKTAAPAGLMQNEKARHVRENAAGQGCGLCVPKTSSGRIKRMESSIVER